jgi:hypothetical protein
VDNTVPKSPDIPEPPPGRPTPCNPTFEIDQRVRHASGWTGRVRAYSQADRAVQVQWDDPTSEPTADADGCSWHHATWLTAISEQDPTCTGCGRPIHRVHGMWLDDLGRGHCAAGAKQGVNSHRPAAAPALAVYVIEQRTNLAAGGHAFQLLPAGYAYPTAVNAQAAVEYLFGAVVWNDRLEGRQPGDRLPLYRIVEVPLATTQGGVR